MTEYIDLDSNYDYLKAARRLDMRASTYWKSCIAPYLANPKSSPHVCRTLKQRVLWDIKDLIPRGVETSMFNAMVKDPMTKVHTGRDLRMEYGISREYVAVRLLGYFERHLASAAPDMPYPLGTYLAVLIPNRISDETIARLVASGEFPHTLAGFKRDPMDNVHQTSALKVSGRLHRTKCAAYGQKRWAEPQVEYLARLEKQRAVQFDKHAAYLTTNPANLKDFAKYLRDTLPVGTSKRMPNPAAVMQYVHQRLRSRIEPHIYGALHAQASQYCAGQHESIKDRLIALK